MKFALEIMNALNKANVSLVDLEIEENSIEITSGFTVDNKKCDELKTLEKLIEILQVFPDFCTIERTDFKSIIITF